MSEDGRAGTLATVVANFRITLAARVCLKALQLAMAIWVVRRLGGEDYGRYSLLTAYYLFYQVGSDLGTAALVLQRAGEPPDSFRSFFQRIFRLRIGLAVLSAAVSVPVTLALGYERELAAWMIAFALPNILLANANQSFVVWFQSRQTMKDAVGGEIAGQLTSLALMCGALALHGGYAALFACLVGGELVRIFYYYRRMPFGPWADREPPYDGLTSREVLASSWPLAVTVILQILLVRVDTILLSRLHSLAAVGFYGAAQKLCLVMTLMAEAFMPLVMPVLARHALREPAKGILFFRLAFKYLTLYCAPIAAGFCLYGTPIMTLLFKKGFEPAGLTLAINAWATLAGLLYTITNYLMISLKLERVNVVYLGSSVVLNVLANLWVLPRYGADGAACTSILAYMAYVVVCALSPLSRPFILPALGSTAAPILIACAAALVPWKLGYGLLPGVFAYGAVFLPMAALLFASVEDRAVLKKLLQWRTEGAGKTPA